MNTVALKPKKCKAPECGKTFVPVKHMQVVCNFICGIKYNDHKKAEKKRKAYNAETRRRKKALLTASDWVKKIQPNFNKMIRVRDRHLPCISCGRTNEEVEQTDGWKPGGAWDCGHFLSVGSHPELRFTETNAHKQCKSCNGGSGQYTKKNHTVSQEYRERLIKRIGLEEVERLEGPHPPAKWTVEELEEMGKQYRARTREMEREIG